MSLQLPSHVHVWGQCDLIPSLYGSKSKCNKLHCRNLDFSRYPFEAASSCLHRRYIIIITFMTGHHISKVLRCMGLEVLLVFWLTLHNITLGKVTKSIMLKWVPCGRWHTGFFLKVALLLHKISSWDQLSWLDERTKHSGTINCKDLGHALG